MKHKKQLTKAPSTARVTIARYRYEVHSRRPKSLSSHLMASAPNVDMARQIARSLHATCPTYDALVLDHDTGTSELVCEGTTPAAPAAPLPTPTPAVPAKKPRASRKAAH